MMINIKTLKQKITLLQYIEKTLKSVESININKKTLLKKQKDNYFIMDKVFNNLKNINHGIKNSKEKCLIIVGSDSSLCGSYNSSIIKYSQKNSIDNYDTIYILGKKIKKISLKGSIIYQDYKNFFKENSNFLYERYGFNIDFLGYHGKNISHKNLLDVYNNIPKNLSSINDEFIIEGDVFNSLSQLFFQYCLSKIIYGIEEQENNQRLIFLKSAIENCENEIQNNLKTYRSLRQENITREINELISGRC